MADVDDCARRELAKAAERARIAADAAEYATNSRSAPTYEQFGLTEPRAELLRARGRRVFNATVKIALAVSFAGCLWFFYRSFKPSGVGGWLVVLFITGITGTVPVVVGGLFVALLGLALGPVTRRILPDRYRLGQYDRALSAYQAWKARTERAFWLSLSPVGFEREVAGVFRRMGYVAALTPRSGDKGVDIHLSRGDERAIVQCKATTAAAGPGVVRELIGTMAVTGASRAIIASRAGFTSGARELAQAASIELMDLNAILYAWRTQS